MDLLAQLSWVDGALLAVLAASVIVGLVRGFVFECLSLAGWLVAWFAAQWGAPSLAPHLPVGVPGSPLNLGAAFAVAFIAALVAWGLLATPLSIPDRLLGAVFGLLRGGVLLLAVATVVGLTPAAQSRAWRDAKGALWLQQALVTLKPLLPEAAARHLPS